MARRPLVERGVISPRRQVRQLMVGLMALPLTAVPFVAYANLTPEGRLVRDRAIVALAPPTLPTLTPRAVDAATAAAPRYAGGVMALAYHGIGSASDSEGGFVVSAKRFGEHLATLRAAGMNTVTAADVAAAFTGGPALPPNAVMLSFDDGRSDAMMFADPLLKQAGMKATMFVISGAASEPGVYYASWDKIEGYAKSGRWDIQSHTAASHREHDAAGAGSLPALTSLAKGETLDEYRLRVREDLREASDAIENHIGRRPVAFAYPFGAYGADRNNEPAIIDVLREEVAREYEIAFQQDDQDTVPVLTPDQDHLLLRRVEVENWTGLQLLQRIDRAARPGPWDGVVSPAPEELALPVGPLLPAPAASPPAPPTTRPGGATTPTPRVPAGAVSPVLSNVTLPSVSIPPVNVTLPPVNLTVPPLTVPPLPVVTTTPPTTKPPATTTTTRPRTTTTTACKPARKSGKCAGA
ncbi:MAG TPA: polysaccharide deacetylase family protein [Acidimicrobiales bacterium]|nr:polysaccharide deacetylase family protein [Acidimicrobiales bacterium]